MRKFKLKPCPFCGSTAVAFQEVGSYENGQPMWYRGVCQHCTAQSQMDGTKEKAVNRWNERSGSSDSSEDKAQKHMGATQDTLKKVKEGKADIMRLIDLGNIRIAAVALSHCILDRKNWTAISDIMNDKDKMRKEEERFASDLEFAKCVTHLTNQITDVFFAPPSININTKEGQALKALFKDFIDQGYVPGEFKMAAYDAACRVQFAQQTQRHS